MGDVHEFCLGGDVELFGEFEDGGAGDAGEDGCGECAVGFFASCVGGDECAVFDGEDVGDHAGAKVVGDGEAE